jgi:phosphatidylglycerophosphate synthase
MVFGCLAGGMLAATTSLDSWSMRAAWLAGAVFVQLRLLANMFDGMVAIERDVASAVGELYNEIPDRVSDVAILIGLGYGVGGEPMLGYVAACVAIFVAYVRAMGVAAGAAQAFIGPMAKPQRMFAVTVAAVYCGVTPATWQPQFGPDGRSIASFVLALVVLGGLWTAARRIHRIARDLRKASA